jgi:hypothetical protein
MKETICLKVYVHITYKDFKERKEAIAQARKCVTAQSLLGRTLNVTPTVAHLFDPAYVRRLERELIVRRRWAASVPSNNNS